MISDINLGHLAIDQSVIVWYYNYAYTILLHVVRHITIECITKCHLYSTILTVVLFAFDVATDEGQRSQLKYAVPLGVSDYGSLAPHA